MQRTTREMPSSDDRKKFNRCAARPRYPAGAAIVAAGSTVRLRCSIACGQVEMHAAGAPRKAPRVQRGDGEVFGILGFLDGAPSSVTGTAVAAGPAEPLLFPPEALPQPAAWQPGITVAMPGALCTNAAAHLRRLQPGD